MKVFDDLADKEWALLQELFYSGPAPSERRGRPPVDARAVVNAVLWVLASGESWTKLPGRYPSQPTCRRRFEQWRADGTLAEIVRRLDISGRKISLHESLSAPPAKPLVSAFNDRLRGAFWTNPASWCAGPTGPLSPTD